MKSADEVNAMVETLLENMDFEKIHALMVVNKWTWSTYDYQTKVHENQVPTLEALKITARTLIVRMLGEPIGSSIGTGGFNVSVLRMQNSVPDHFYRLSFDWASAQASYHQ